MTDLVARADGVPEPRTLLSRTGVVAADGHSDYGRVFECFWHEHARHGVGPSTTLILTGDAAPTTAVPASTRSASCAERAKRVYGSPRAPRRLEHGRLGDRAVRATCTDVFEVRTLRQLGDAAASIV